MDHIGYAMRSAEIFDAIQRWYNSINQCEWLVSKCFYLLIRIHWFVYDASCGISIRYAYVTITVSAIESGII